METRTADDHRSRPVATSPSAGKAQTTPRGEAARDDPRQRRGCISTALPCRAKRSVSGHAAKTVE